jgi:VanZ family protein
MINYFSKYKFIFYLCNFILIFLYLFPGSLLGLIIYKDISLQPQITSDFIFISTNHLYAYIVLSVIGFLTYRKNNQFNILSIYLIFLSIVLEVLQYFVPNRSFEFSDLFGNLAGVIITIILFYFFKNNENFKN